MLCYSLRYVADAYSSPQRLAYGRSFVDKAAYVYLFALFLANHEEILDGRCVSRVCSNQLVGLLSYARVNTLSLVETVENDIVLALLKQGLVVPLGSCCVDVGQEDMVSSLIAIEANSLGNLAICLAELAIRIEHHGSLIAVFGFAVGYGVELDGLVEVFE